jgi:DNA-binding NarL/FixJ family response regulator
MRTSTRPLVGRDLPLRTITDWITARTTATGGPHETPPALFVSGEAGIGKTALIRAATDANAPVLWASAVPWSPTPYGLLGQVVTGQVFSAPTAEVTAAAVRDALLEAASPIVLVLEDLHWADGATLELLPDLIEAITADPVAMIVSYRSDELPRAHPIRALRAQLRRHRRVTELSLSPLDTPEVGKLLALLLGAPPAQTLVDAVAERTDGVPFFVEELLAGMDSAGWLTRDEGRVRLGTLRGGPILPESVGDAVQLRLAGLAPDSHRALEAAAVLGVEFDLDAVAVLTGQDWTDELDHCGLLQTLDGARRRFRHALTHEAVYADVPWTRRRVWHLAAAERLAGNGPAATLARHLLAARDFERARPALVAAADEHLRVYACRDAAGLLHTALDTWPPGVEDGARRDVVDRLARCAELSGDHLAAVTVLRELADVQTARSGSPVIQGAETHRRLAVQYELLGQWPPALAAREAAARGFADAGMAARSAAEWLAMASHLRSAAGFSAALEALDRADENAWAAGHADLLSRISGMRGNVLARMGRGEEGVPMVQAALDAALAGGLTAPAAEIYQRLADSLEHTGDYRAAGQAYEAAYDFCRLHDEGTAGQLCRACATVVMFHGGRWDRALALSAGVLADPDAGPHARAVAFGVRGLVEVMRGRTRQARSALLESWSLALRIELVAMELLSTWGLAMVDAEDGRTEQAVEGYRHLVERCSRTQERHFCVPALQFAVTCFATAGTRADAGRVVDVLAEAVDATGQPEARAALAHALGECALLDGEARRAVPHFRRALELLAPLDLPVVATLTRRRLGLALASYASGADDDCADLLLAAYRTAHRLRARPLVEGLARELHQHGVEPAAGASRAPLTTRQEQALRLVGEGLTSKEIAARLFLSVRTVEMHVRNAMSRLGARTRAEAVRRLGETYPASDPARERARDSLGGGRLDLGDVNLAH